MVTQGIISAVVMGILFVAVAVAATRLASAPAREGQRRFEQHSDRLGDLSENPAFLGLLFVVVTLLAGVLTLAAMGAVPLPEGVSGFGLVLAVMGLLIAVFMFLGPYVLARQYGLGNAHGIGAGISGLSLVFLLVIVAQLLVGVV